jgi:hypothetical protein
MSRPRRKANMAGLIVIGCALVAVGISTDNYGIMAGGVVFIIVGAAVVVRSRKTGGNDNGTDS